MPEDTPNILYKEDNVLCSLKFLENFSLLVSYNQIPVQDNPFVSDD